MSVILDTGFIYALADQDDGWHKRAREYLIACREVPLVPVTILPEVAYLLHKRLSSDAERTFARSLASGELILESLQTRDIRRCVDLLATYPEIGFVDASVVAMAERLGIRTIATTDRRDFTAIRPRHVKRFQLVP